jgi:hypothetical protein
MEAIQATVQASMAQVQETTSSALAQMQTETKTGYGQIQQAVQNTMMTQIPQITTQGTTLTSQISTTFLDTLKNAWQTAQTTIQQGTSAFFDWTGMTFTQALAAIGQLWQNAWIQVETIISNIYANIQKRSTEWWPQMTGLFTQQIALLQQTWSNAWMMMEQTLTTSLMRMSSTAQSVLGSILMQVQNVMMQIQQAAAQLQANLVTHSIWPDMLGTMESMTSAAMNNIQSTVSSGFKSVVSQAQTNLAQLESIRQQAVAFLNAPQAAGFGGNLSAAFLSAQQATAKATEATKAAQSFGTVSGGGYTYDVATIGQVMAKEGYWNPATSMNLSGQSFQDYAQALANATQYAKFGTTGPGKVTVPVSVIVDGATVAKTVETRLIQQRQIAGI